MKLPLRESTSGCGSVRTSAVLVRVAEDELARLERRARCRASAHRRALDRRLRQPVAVAEVIVRIVERRRGFEIERGKHFDAGESREQTLDAPPGAALALRDVARKEDDDRVEVGARQSAHPIVGMVVARVAEHLGAGDHALAELLGKGRQRSLVHAERTQAVPGEGHGDPARRRRPRSPSRPLRNAPFQRCAASQARPAAASRNDRNS